VTARPKALADESFTVRRAELPDDWPAVAAIRTRVFVEEQRCPPDEEFDRHEAVSRHFLGLAGGRPVAAARWREVSTPVGPAAKLERFAVLPGHRGRGRGAALVRHLLADAGAAGHRRFVLHAQAHLEDFYRRLGFTPTGERFEEAGIPHLKMVLAADDEGATPQKRVTKPAV
jgi:predicted GNAT family N-acyltransferase